MRLYVLGLYRRGELATLEEGATIAGVTRRRVLAWLDAEAIDWRKARLRFIARHCRRAGDAVEGKTPKRMSKAQLRAIGERARKAWETRKRGKASP